MVADWIIGIWTAIASISIITGCIMFMVNVEIGNITRSLHILIVGVVMMIFSAMHYSGM